MVQTNQASRTELRERAPSVRQIEASPSAVAAFIGVSERGPIATPTLVTSFDEYRKFFGSYTVESDLALAVKGFFENGGQQVYVVRTVHFTDPADSATQTGVAATDNLVTPGAASAASLTGSQTGPVELVDGDTLSVSPSGAGPFTGTVNAGSADVTAANNETFALSDAQTLIVVVNGGSAQTVTFNTADFSNIALATAAEVAAVINEDLVGASAVVVAGPTVEIRSDRKGTGASIQVTGGTSNGVLGFPTGVVNGTGNVADVSAVTVAELETILEAAVAGIAVTQGSGNVIVISTVATGVAATLEITGGTAQAKLGLASGQVTGSDSASASAIRVDAKYVGTYGNDVDVSVQAASSGAAAEFNLVVSQGGVVQKTHVNLSTDPTASRYFETIVNDAITGDRHVQLTDLGLSGNPRPENQTITLSGGDDGLSGIVDADYYGDSAGLTGMRALDNTTGIRLIAIPGRATPAVQTALVDYCEVTRERSCFAVLGSPEALDAAAMNAYMDSSLLYDRSEHGIMVWPRVKIVNPSTAVFGSEATILVPVEGHVCGLIAKKDSSTPGGVYQSPAGPEDGIIRGIVGVETDEVFSLPKRDLVAARNANSLNRGTQFYLDGVYCLETDENFPTLSERRGAIFIGQAIKDGMEFFRYKNNTARNRGLLRLTIERFLNAQTKLGAFASDNPDEAYLIQISADPEDIFANRFVVRVGLAMAKPAIFIFLELSSDRTAIEESLV